MNIHDIAREAGVSTATVSRVINSPERVEESTRVRVLQVIQARAYTPNALARGLLHNRTKSIGVLTVDILNPYYATVVHAIERHLSTSGNTILLCSTGGSHAEKVRYIRILLEKRVDGLVFVGSVYRERDGAEEILSGARSVPIVMINSIIEAPNINCILCDDRAGVRLALDHAMDGGRKNILFISTQATSSSRLKEAECILHATSRGFQVERSGIPGTSALPGSRNAGVCADDESFASSPSRTSCGHLRIVETAPERLAELPAALVSAWEADSFDAILASDDLFANVAVNTLHTLHLGIPEDVWVIGYNNSYVSEQTYPRLTSVDSRMEDLGATTADRLTRILNGETVTEPVCVLQPRLVIKETSSSRG